MALFVPLDASYDQDPKVLDLEDERAELLFVRSLAYSKRHLLDGLIHRKALGAIAPFADEVAPAALAAELVRVGLWTAVDRGWVITAWLKRNPASETILTPTKGLELAHTRHHVNKGVVNEACLLCVGEPQVTTQVACVDAVRIAQSAMPEPESVPEPEPEPSHSSLRTTNDPAPEPVTRDVDEQSIRRTASLIGRTVASKAGAAKPDAYAFRTTRAILDDPEQRARIVASLTEGQTPEVIAASWIPDPLAGILGAATTAQPEHTRPTVPVFDPAAHDAEAEAQRQWLDQLEPTS